MGINILLAISLAIQFCVFWGIYKTIGEKCKYKIRLVFSYLIYIFLVGTLCIRQERIAYTGILFVIVVIIGTTAYEYTSLQRIYSVVTGCGVTFLSYICVYIWKFQKYRNTFEESLFSISIIQLILFLASVVLHKCYVFLLGRKEHSIIMNEQIKFYKGELAALENYNSTIRSIKHDLNNHLDVIKNLVMSDEKEKAISYINTIQNSSKNVEAKLNTGNYELDSIINSKINIMDYGNISYSKEIVVPNCLNIEPVDMVIIIGNVMDNAIRAVKEYRNVAKSDNEETDIIFSIIYSRGVLSIEVDNLCLNTDKNDKYNSFSDITLPDFLNTTHEDYSNHGIGIGNVISVVKKYEGFMEINRSKGRFNTYIELYI